MPRLTHLQQLEADSIQIFREAVAESERALEALDEEERRALARHVQDQASLSNTVKVARPEPISVPTPTRTNPPAPPPCSDAVKPLRFYAASRGLTLPSLSA